MELAQVVILQRLTQVYLPLLQIEQDYRLRCYQQRLQTDHELQLARIAERALRQRVRRTRTAGTAASSSHRDR